MNVVINEPGKCLGTSIYIKLTAANNENNIV